MTSPTTIPDIYSIYALVDPETQATRYVGCTKNPHTRLHVHCASARSRRGGNVGLEIWINNLGDKGKRPIFVILDTADIDNRLEKERLWIERMLHEGQPILNRYLSGSGRLETIPSYTRAKNTKRQPPFYRFHPKKRNSTT